ncbi:hypothetical protein [Mesorhizobium sp. B263B2A]|uniref:hypothetical protein n=1 Tax=Mesorhizobium sp. B263B2A TaxID=2876669 RepID=UPI001CD0F1AF|nr:hypothetical protein [Mesorhizobium sp. B263B2A]MCA0032761.1 hypothetical protein [Mesorhizobium sp. B263B2A]
MARLQSSSVQFTVAAQKTLAETQKLVVKIAKREHGKIMATAPRPTSFKRVVDGRLGAPEEAVKPNGVIVYFYPRLEEVAQFAMETLYDLSPVLSGRYRNAHTLFVSGVAVPNLKNYKGGEITISNPEPYARKIEVGAMKMRVPPHVYERAVKIVRARFGNVAKIGFTYRGLTSTGGSVLTGRRGNRSDLRYPVMLIKEID